MFGSPRYEIPGNRDDMTGYIYLHPGKYNQAGGYNHEIWAKVETALTKAVASKKRSARVDLTDVGSPQGNDLYVYNYPVIGPSNKGEQTNDTSVVGLGGTPAEIPLNSISFKLKKDRIASYTFDAVDDRFDCTVNLKKGYVRGRRSRPMTLREVFVQHDLMKSDGPGAAFSYFDRITWSTQQYGIVQGGSEIGVGGGRWLGA